MRTRVRVTLTLDPATTDKARSDFSGIMVNLTDSSDTWHIAEADNFKGKPDEVVARMVYFARMYKPAEIGVETVGGHIIYIPLMRPYLKEAGINCPIREIRYPSYLSKRAKIEKLQPRFKQGKIKIRRGLSELLRQLDQYPELDHDDLLDALVLQQDISKPPSLYSMMTAARFSDEEEDDDDEDSDRSNRKLNGAYIGLGTPTRR